MRAIRSFLAYVPENSLARRLNPVSKALVLIAPTVAAILSADVLVNLISLAFLLALFIIFRIPLRGLAKVVALAVGGLATFLFFLNLVFNPIEQGQVYLKVTIMDRTLFTGRHVRWVFVISDANLRLALRLYLRFLVFLYSAVLFFMISSDADLVLLLRALRAPYVLGFMLALCLRCFSIFAQEWFTVLDGQRTRGVDFASGSVVERARRLAYLSLPMVMLTLKRAEEFSRSVEARGFSLKGRRTYYREIRWSRADLVFCAVMISYMVLSIILLAVRGGLPWPL